MSNRLSAPHEAESADAGYADPQPRMGFFTDTSICIGCKACEVACKEWNGIEEDGMSLTGMSYDNTEALGASTWTPCRVHREDRAGHGARATRYRSRQARLRSSSGADAACPGRESTGRRSCGRRWPAMADGLQLGVRTAMWGGKTTA